MKIQIRYFASIREALGRPSEEVLTASTTLGGLRSELAARGGAYAEVLAPGRPVRMARDQVMGGEHVMLTEGCEVAFFPPVTGG